MIYPVASYLAGGMVGFAATLVLIADAWNTDVIAWTMTNLGQSVWFFLGCLGLYLITLGRLRYRLEERPSYQTIVQLDQLSDVWIHVFVGIGVVWTAIGMRSALVSTLSVPESLASYAGQVLTRLVDGGILLALSTTIVGAIGGYLMRLFKTLSLGALLTEYYHCQERDGFETALDHLKNIERLLEASNFNRSAS
ncbi:MAG: hypothetical protein HOE54_09485 [Gammaproteobacteria bacterium]|nr:hypothetical protein [Gammaproteobacteria bacterium]